MIFYLSPVTYADFTRSQWLTDLSRELPSAQLDGFDVSEDQYPNKAWLPSNISLSHLDITKEIPPNLEGMYDLLHVQLFLCVVQRDGPAAILAQLYKLLSGSSSQSDKAMLISLLQSQGVIFNGSNTTPSLSESCHLILH